MTVNPYALSLSKVHGTTPDIRYRLKRQRIVHCGQLLAATADRESRRRLARSTGIPVATLHRLAERADLLRINGIGYIFGMMLEELGGA